MTDSSAPELGNEMYALAGELFPICRSITGNGVRNTLEILKRYLPELTVHEVASGTECFDWTIPDEWNIRDAYLVGPDGRKFAQFSENNLHVLGYSESVDITLSLDDLQDFLYSLPDYPDAIPYVTSYYEKKWGFCLSHNERQSLKPGTYRVVIDSTLAPGSLTYGEIVLPGESKEEVFLSTYTCHPSLANNELSGLVVATFLMRYLKSLPQRRYTYRLVFTPETIGAVAHLSSNLEHLTQNVIAAFNISCVGDNLEYSFLPSRLGGTLSDRVALHVLSHIKPDFVNYSFLDRGSNERQYCWPGIDLPMVSIMRTKYGEYPEYHTSKDDLTFISPEGLFGGFEANRRSLEIIERNRTFKATTVAEPQLGKRDMYPASNVRVVPGRGDVGLSIQKMMTVMIYSDGSHDLLAIADMLGCPFQEIADVAEKLLDEGLIA